MLKKSRDANYLRTVWSEAQKYFTSKGKSYKDILPLVKKAAEVNGKFFCLHYKLFISFYKI